MDNSVEKAQRIRFWLEDPRVRGVVENVADGVIGIDALGYIELFNRAAERLFGYDPGEVMGRNVKMLMPPAYGDRHDGFIAHYLKSGQRHIIGTGREVSGRRKDGSTFPMYLSVGEITVREFRGFIGIVHDLTAQKAAEREVGDAREFLQSIIDSMPSALIGVGHDGRITHWNRAAAEDRGLAPHDAVGRPFGELFPFVDLSLDEIARAIRDRHPVKKERVPLPAGGTLRYVDVLVYPLVHDSAGAVVRIDDVTERVRIEEMMVQTEKMMSVGGLAAGMAHEINNPLGILAQGCQNLARRVSREVPDNLRVASELGLDLDQVREYLGRRGFFRFVEGMQDATARATRIVSDMLTYSRRSASSFEAVHLNELIDTVLRLAGHDYDLKKGFDFRRIRIQRESAGSSDEVYCDELAIEQVVLNLLRNAAQAMAASPPAETPEIRLLVADEDQHIRLEVADNGPGMTEEVARRLFEPFFTTKPVGVGTGLGLSVAYFIVTEQHHGSLEVRSAPGQGARFIVRLPRERRPYGSSSSGRR
ncbi:MAG: PAS domain S-box protein [Chromatiaceae bacterium]